MDNKSYMCTFLILLTSEESSEQCSSEAGGGKSASERKGSMGGHGRNPLRNCYILQRAVQKWRVFRGVLNLDVILGGW